MRSVVWRICKNSFWEAGWLEELLAGFAEPGGLESGCVIIAHNPGPEIAQEMERYNCLVVQVSDEYLNHNRPPGTEKVWRNYLLPEDYLARQTQVNYLPLGYKRGFWDGYTGPPPNEITAAQRRYRWSFAGCTRKSDRADMLQALSQVEAGKVHLTSYWDSPDNLSTADYRNLLLDSLFVPSPVGNYNIECFRTYEALEAGAIPITPISTPNQPFDYYRRLAELNGMEAPPFPRLNSWQEAAALINGMSPEEMERLRLRCHSWWLKYKAQLKALIRS